MNIKLAIAILLQISVASNVRAATHWVQESSPHFALYSSYDEKTNHSILQSLEDARRYWAFKVGETNLTSAVVVAVKSNWEYFPLAGYRETAAFSTNLPSGEDAMVVTDLTYQGKDLIRYEYAHFVLSHAYHLPWWLEEGLSNLYSTSSVKGDTAVIGKLRIDLGLMAANPNRFDGADVPNLLSTSRPSKAQMSTGSDGFGADACALVHMLMLSPEYAYGFTQLLDLLNGGESSDKALRQVYDKSPKEIGVDLSNYVWHKMPVEHIALPPSSDLEVSPATQLSADSVWRIKVAVAKGQQAVGVISDPRTMPDNDALWHHILCFHWLGAASLLSPPPDALTNTDSISKAAFARPSLSR